MDHFKSRITELEEEAHSTSSPLNSNHDSVSGPEAGRTLQDQGEDRALPRNQLKDVRFFKNMHLFVPVLVQEARESSPRPFIQPPKVPPLPKQRAPEVHQTRDVNHQPRTKGQKSGSENVKVGGPSATANPMKAHDPFTYEGWTFHKAEPEEFGKPLLWSRVIKARMNVSQEELARCVRKRKMQGPIIDLYKGLGRWKRAQVDHLVETRVEESGIKWTVAHIKTKDKERRSGRDVEVETLSMDIILSGKPYAGPPVKDSSVISLPARGARSFPSSLSYLGTPPFLGPPPSQGGFPYTGGHAPRGAPPFSGVSSLSGALLQTRDISRSVSGHGQKNDQNK